MKDKLTKDQRNEKQFREINFQKSIINIFKEKSEFGSYLIHETRIKFC